MSKASAASKIAKKLAGKAESKAVQMSEAAAKQVLEKYSDVDVATKLMGPERKAYLEALDTVYGPQAQRAKDLGFGDRTWYHGSTVDIPAFEKEALGASTKAQSAKKGFFFASDPSTASDYADLAREKGINRETIRASASGAKYFGKMDELAEKHGMDVQDLRALHDDGTLGSKIGQTEADELNKLKDEYSGAYDAKYKAEEPREEKLERLNNLKNIVDERRYRKNSPERARELARLQSNLDSRVQDIETSNGQQVGAYRLKGSPENIHVKNYKGQGYRDSTYADEMTQAQADGKTGVLFKNTYDPADPNNRVKQDIAAVFEPEQIRSTNAAFDPRFKKSGNVLALTGGRGKTSNHFEVPTYAKNIAQKLSKQYVEPAYDEYVRQPLSNFYDSVVHPGLKKLDSANEAVGRNTAVNNVANVATKIASRVPRAIDNAIAPIESLYQSPEQKIANSMATDPAKVAEQVGPVIEVATDFAAPDVTWAAGPVLRGIKKGLPMMNAVKGSQIAERMIVPPKSAAQVYQELRAADKAAKYGHTILVEPKPQGLGSVKVIDAPAVKPGKVKVVD